MERIDEEGETQESSRRGACQAGRGRGTGTRPLPCESADFPHDL